MNTTKAILNPEEAAVMGRLLFHQHPRFGLLWLIGLTTGLRISDLLRLRVSDVITPSHIVTQKTGARIFIGVSAAVHAEVKLYADKHRLASDDFLFYRSSARRDIPMTRQWAHIVIARTARIMGLRYVGVHSMRKMYACDLFRLTGDLRAVQTALGHKYPSTTLIYLKDILEQNVIQAGTGAPD